MGKIEGEKSPLWKFDHVGVVVRDMDNATAFYQSLGIGPFEPSAIVGRERERTLRGKLADDIKIKEQSAQIGQVRLQLIQPVAGESLHKKFLEDKGEGVNHVAFIVDDLDKEVAKLAEKGLKVISSVTYVKGGGEVYLDTAEVAGFYIQLTQPPPE